jgi:hypothetical protein
MGDLGLVFYNATWYDPYNSGTFDIRVDENGMVAPGTGGLSTLEQPRPGWSDTWAYPSDAPVPDGINIADDQPGLGNGNRPTHVREWIQSIAQ